MNRTDPAAELIARNRRLLAKAEVVRRHAREAADAAEERLQTAMHAQQVAKRQLHRATPRFSLTRRLWAAAARDREADHSQL
jgi:hypothetical protein